MAHTLPHLEKSGGALLFYGRGGHFLIGPADERWDAAMLVRQRDVAAFLAFASNAEYLAGLGHRTAALEDSRLLPLSEEADLRCGSRCAQACSFARCACVAGGLGLRALRALRAPLGPLRDAHALRAARQLANPQRHTSRSRCVRT